MNKLVISNKNFSNIVEGNNFNTIESSNSCNLVLACNSNKENSSISFLTKQNDEYYSNLRIQNNQNIFIDSNLNISDKFTINNIKINNFISNDKNTSSGTIIKGPINSSLYLGIDGDDNKDSFNILLKKNNLYENLFCIKNNGIGIKNCNPKSELDINGILMTNQIKIRNNDKTSIIFNEAENFKLGIFLENTSFNFNNDSNNLLTIMHDGEYEGNLGIGTDNPQNKLDINSSSIRIRQPTFIEPDYETIGNIGEIRWSKDAIYILTDIENNKYIWKKSILKDISD